MRCRSVTARSISSVRSTSSNTWTTTLAGLTEQRRVLSDRGRMVTAVPADPRLWSAHDEAVGHKRRYTRRTFGELAASCDVVAERSTYFFSFLWLPARVLRGSGLRQKEPGGSPGVFGNIVRRVIGAVCAMERWLLANATLPFGSSLWIESRPAPSSIHTRTVDDATTA
jgi:hypothetical protein